MLHNALRIVSELAKQPSLHHARTLAVFSSSSAPDRSRAQSPPDGLDRGSMNVGCVPVKVKSWSVTDCSEACQRHNSMKSNATKERIGTFNVCCGQELTSGLEPRSSMRVRSDGTSNSVEGGGGFVEVVLYLHQPKSFQK